MGSYRQLMGMAKPRKSEPERVQPVPEEYEGVNFPYRGTQQHGVAVPDDAQYDTREFQHEEEEPFTDYLPEEDEPEPFPVRIVQATARERLEWRVSRAHVSGSVQLVVGRLDTRKRLYVKVESDSSDVYLGPDPNVHTYTGYRASAGEILEFFSTEALYATCEIGQEATLSVRYEFGVEL